MLRLLSLFIVIPLLDLFLVFKIGTLFGIWPVLALIVFPGLLGAFMIRSQGASIFSIIKKEISQGKMPGNQIMDGFLIVGGGLLLITPGIITGLIGLTVLSPRIRKFYRDFILYRLWRFIARRSLRLNFKKPF